MATIAEALALAIGHHRAGRLQTAEPIYRQILAVEPQSAEALHMLGILTCQLGRCGDGIELIRQAVLLAPDVPAYHNSLGEAYRLLGRWEEAIQCYRCRMQLEPDSAAAHFNLGAAWKALRRPAEAIPCYHRAIELKPDYAEAYSNLGNALREIGAIDESTAACRRAIQLLPTLAEAHSNLGIALMEQGQVTEAIACYRRAIGLKPDFAAAHSNLGSAWKAQGRLAAAVGCLRRAAQLAPHDARMYSNVVYTLHFCPEYDAAAIYAEHCGWNRQYAAPLAASVRPHSNDRRPERRLRIGYVSPDFRRHSVGRFMLPLLEAHDHGGYEIFCYAAVRSGDWLTDRCRAAADAWRDVTTASDEELSDAVRQDQIDILVDLTMHMADNRLLVFARKPAPVQVTYLAYCSTTGLTAIDYRLSDPYLDPPAAAGPIYSEETICLPETYWCYRPMMETPPPNRLPALQAGCVTFGCLNNFCKVTPPTLLAWRRLLQATGQSRLLLHAPEGAHRDGVREFFAQAGISADRLTFCGTVSAAEYFQLHQTIDVALDPFPYGGGTTTCDALWMGVPVVSLAGQTAVGRGGLSILSNLGLPELVGHDAEHYVQIAAALAADLPRLSELRASLRARMEGSPLMDAPRFARNVEAAYRDMWRRWCEK